MGLRKLLPKDRPCYFIKNVANHIYCSEANHVFADTHSEFVYHRELLLRLFLIVFLMEDYLPAKLNEELKQMWVICT